MLDETYVEQLDVYMEPNNNNKRFKSLNDSHKNLVVSLGLKMMDKGMKEVQLWKNDEWQEKIRNIEHEKNKEIDRLNDVIDIKTQKFDDFIEEHKTNINVIKKQVQEQAKSIYESKIKALEERLDQQLETIEKEKEAQWSLKEDFHNQLSNKIDLIRREEEEKRTSLRKNYDSLLEKEREKYLEFSKRQENSTLLGQDGENFTYHKLNMLFPKSDVIDTHDQKQCGDFKLVYKNLPLLLEVKNYKGNVLKKEILKFKRDMEYQSEMKGGIFISLKSGISARDDFQMEVYDGKPVLFLTYVKDNMEKIRLAVKFIETLVKENIDLKNEEIAGGLKKLIPVIKRKWNTLKGTLENFKNKMSRDLLEQESNIIEIFKIIGMKY